MKRSLFHPGKFVVHFKLSHVRLTWIGAGWVDWYTYREQLQETWPYESIRVIR